MFDSAKCKGGGEGGGHFFWQTGMTMQHSDTAVSLCHTSPVPSQEEERSIVWKDELGQAIVCEAGG